LLSRNNLAGAYREAGRLDDAITLHQQTLTDYERILGPDHPHTLLSRNNLAGAYRNAGRHDEAIALYEQTLLGFERVLSPGHPSIGVVTQNLDRTRREREEQA
jgi:tetratricopeptide (TPR) repeat protein